MQRAVSTTYASGNFLFTDPAARAQVLLIDGPSSLYPGVFVSLAALGLFSGVNALDPVLLQTGMFNLEQTDMVLPGRYTYGPFGETTVNGLSSNPIQFTGRENDGTGLYYYRARYYNPSHGRFLAEDPLEFSAGDANLYAYVANNPKNFTDPSGEIKLPPVIKQCLAGLIKSIAIKVGINIAGRKPDANPIDPVDAVQSCMSGGGNKPGVVPTKGAFGSGDTAKGDPKRSKVSPSGPTTVPIGGDKFSKTTTTVPGKRPRPVTNRLRGHQEPEWRSY